MPDLSHARPTGYDRYVNYKTFSIAVAAFVLILLAPTPSSMRDVAVEYAVGEQAVHEFLAQELFGRPFDQVEQWQALTARILEHNMRQGALTRRNATRLDLRQVRRMGFDPEPSWQ